MDDKLPEKSGPRGTPIVSTVLDDGRLVELVEDGKVTHFAVGDADGVEIVDTVAASDGTVFVPVSATNNLIKHRAVLLPVPREPMRSPSELLAEIEAYIAGYVDLSEDFLRITSAYVLLSWVYDAFNELPYLRFRGEYGSGKTRALLVVGSLMWKPMFASGASTISPIFHALDLFRGTLVIDEADFRMSDEKAELVKILNQGNVRGFPVLRSQATLQKTFDPRAFHVFGPKLVAMRHSFSDEALESRFLTEEMGQRPVRKDIPINLPDVYADEAQVLRCRLLGYRFGMRARMGIRTDRYHSSLTPRTNQIVAPLLSVVEDERLRDAIVRLMRGTEDDLAVRRASRPEGELAEVLSALSTTDTRDAIPVGDIAHAFRDKCGEAFERPITARYVGYLLRERLRLRARKRQGVFVVRRADLLSIRTDRAVAEDNEIRP